jgi:hypothetical protein
VNRIFIITIVGLFIGLVAFVCTLSWIACDRAIHPETEVSPYKLSQFDLPAEDVRFNACRLVHSGNQRGNANPCTR